MVNGSLAWRLGNGAAVFRPGKAASFDHSGDRWPASSLRTIIFRLSRSRIWPSGAMEVACGTPILSILHVLGSSTETKTVRAKQPCQIRNASLRERVSRTTTRPTTQPPHPPHPHPLKPIAATKSHEPQPPIPPSPNPSPLYPPSLTSLPNTSRLLCVSGPKAPNHGFSPPPMPSLPSRG